MKTGRYLIIILLTAGTLMSCSKKIVTSQVLKVPRRNYDSAAFEHIYIEAVKQKLLGNLGEAMKRFEQCMEINPESDGTYYQMAQILLSGGDLKNCKKYLLKAYTLDNDNLWYLMMLAGTYYQENNIDSAILFYEKAVNNAPDKENLKLTLGNLYTEDKRFNDASKIFEELDRKYGINETTTVAGIRNYIKAGQFDKALETTITLIDKYPDNILYSGLLAEIYREKGEEDKAAQIYEMLMKESPGNPGTQLSLCDFLVKQKRYEELLSLLNIIALNEKITKEEKLQLFGRLIEDDEVIAGTGEKLIMPLMVLEASNKNDGITELLRPELLSRINRREEAAERLEEIIKEEPENYYAWEKLLLVYFDSGNYKKLQERAEICALKFNRSFLAKVLYATAANENKDYSTALEELKKANIIAGNNLEMQLQVLTIQADVYYRMQDYENAFRTFDEAVRLDNSDITLLNNYAYYLAEQNLRLKEAETMAQKVIETEPENNTYLDTYGWVLFKRGKINEAKRIFERIINSNSKPDAEWYEHYGFILKRKRNCMGAVANWKIALELDKSKKNLIEEINKCGK